MEVAITGATGFVGRALVEQLAAAGHRMRCWHRDTSDLLSMSRFDDVVTWIPGDLAADESKIDELFHGCDAVVHSGLWRTTSSFQGAETDLVEYARINLLGSLRLMQAAWRMKVQKFVFVSTCAVHDRILEDRALDEKHPLWPKSHYGAHKAALEKFVHSFGLGAGMPICAIRPTGIYGVQQRPELSKWYSIVRAVVAGEAVDVARGGKEVHVDDVATGIGVLLEKGEAGEAYACYDRYVSQFEVAEIAKELAGSQSEIRGERTVPKNEIDTSKIRELGMKFGGTEKLRATIGQLIEHCRNE